VALEEIGIDQKVLMPLIRSVQKTAISSLNSSRKGDLNMTWRVIIGDPRK